MQILCFDVKKYIKVLILFAKTKYIVYLCLTKQNINIYIMKNVRTIKDSTFYYEDAMDMANHYAETLQEKGIEVFIEDATADCSSMPCPPELGTWSGETSAILVYSFDDDTADMLIAYHIGMNPEIELLAEEINQAMAAEDYNEANILVQRAKQLGVYDELTKFVKCL